MVNKKLIAVDENDVNLMRKECKKLFLESNKEFSGAKITDSFMFKKIVGYYLE